MKQFLRCFREKLLRMLPDQVLLHFERHLRNSDLRGYVQNIRLQRFIDKTDFDQLDVSKMPICSIQKGEWDFPLFQMNFLNSMIWLGVYCLSLGYRPRIDYINHEGTNLWEEFLDQPFVFQNEDKDEQVTVCDVTRVNVGAPLFMTKEDVAKYNRIYRRFINWNDKAKMYFENEYDTVFPAGAKIIGVLCRGTDYTANKPKWHPVQPSIEEVLALVDQKMKEYNCTHIYLATEEKSILCQFEEKYPGKILTNKREYFDAFYDIRREKKDFARIAHVRFDRENDTYYKSLEYCSSLYLLTRCNLLIAGNTGGSRMAAYMNNNKYEYMHLFDKGLY